MNFLSRLLLLFVTHSSFTLQLSASFLFNNNSSIQHIIVPRNMMNSQGCDMMSGHPSTLPGDPSLNLVTNVDLGDKKLEIMKACSKAIEAATGKPEAYIAVSITDKADVIFGGTDAPTALGCLYSIGAIAMESNGAIHSAVSDLLEAHGVEASRIYINFFDMPRANVGWNRKTFAG